MQSHTRIKEFRGVAGISQEKLSELTGIPLGTLRRWEQSGGNIRNAQRLVPIADTLGCSVDDLLGRSLPPNAIRAIADDAAYIDVPLYGSIAAGEPIEMNQIEDHFPVLRTVAEKYPDGFLLKVKGNSMDRRLPDGVYALIDPHAELVSGRVYAINVNGYDATVKRVLVLNNGFELLPDSTDPTFESKVYDFGKPETESVRVIGRVVYHVVSLDYEY
jgi:repressor LexA